MRCLSWSVCCWCALAAKAQAPAAPTKVLEPAVPAIACAAERVFAAQPPFDRPLLVAFTPAAPDLAYVVEQTGRIAMVPRADDVDGADVRRLFADLSDRVHTDANWEEGLLGFAFDPGYRDNGFVWVSRSEHTAPVRVDLRAGKPVKSTRRSVIARYGTAVVEGRRVLDSGSELRVLAVPQPFANHNGGAIAFGPDGMLYVALGDGGAQRDPLRLAQDKGVLLGKVLRLDVRESSAEHPYAVPADNPFVADAGARGEIWCYGLRDPWRLAFDRATGELWCGDVGEDSIEEVDRLQRGGNYGWSLMEGSRALSADVVPPADLIAPVAEYGHRDGMAVIGGHVYRGRALPALVGCYVYGDFATLRIWAVRADAAGARPKAVEIGRAPAQLSSFGEEPDGELLLTCFDGRVYRLVPAPAGR